MNTLFPANPKPGAIFELRAGLYFKYDAGVNSWVRLSSNTIKLIAASALSDGAMTALDLQKLNRLVLPPPLSSITGNDCTSPFQSGNINLTSLDKFVDIETIARVGNISATGEALQKQIPFKIHQHTYGVDFTLDLPALVVELRKRGQLRLLGKPGSKGDLGDSGDPGPDLILSGPPGLPGEAGLAPACSLTVEPDSLPMQPRTEGTKALVGVRVEKDTSDGLKFKLTFDRQSIGAIDFAADKLKVRSDTSPWVLAIASGLPDGSVTGATPSSCAGQQIGAGVPAQVYYLDVEPILDTIRQQFLREVGVLKQGYEDIVSYWIQTMSDLFDSQKQALCCALEHCISATKSTQLRQHMESVAGSAAGSANVLLHGRDSTESVTLSSTRVLKQIGGPDLCKGGPVFPQYPNLETGGVGVPSSAGADNIVPLLPVIQAQSLEGVERATAVVDPFIHASVLTGVQIPLVPGDYIAQIESATAQVDSLHRANVKIQYLKAGLKKTVQFLDKGGYASVRDAQAAYEGLTLAFRHDGGMVAIWLPSELAQGASGNVRVLFYPSTTVPPQESIEVIPEMEIAEARQPLAETRQPTNNCEMTVEHLAWYEKGWLNGSCCGVVVNVLDQDYIIVKRSIGVDMACGGGESLGTPCIQSFFEQGHPAFAWPTFDGKRFAPLPREGVVNFHFDEYLNTVVLSNIATGNFSNGKGNPDGLRHLTYQLTLILFPLG